MLNRCAALFAPSLHLDERRLPDARPGDALGDFLWYLPFRYTMSFPVEVLLGRLATAVIIQSITIQWLWVGAMYALCRVVWRKGLRRYSAVGA